MASVDDDSSSLSDLSSELTIPSRSPTPPSEMYPSPPPTQQSSVGSTPTPEGRKRSPSDEDALQPAKRRKVEADKPRTTKYLDLNTDLESSSQKEQLDGLLKVLHKRRKIVVVAGAGISVSAGIPDFRSSTGLFSTLKSEHNLKGSGKHLFDASVYKDDTSTSTFHDMVSKMSTQTTDATPTEFHHLLATLAHEDRLLRLYSQNVDGLDARLEPLKTEVPLPRKGPWPKTIQLHGGLGKMVCSKCHQTKPFDPKLFNGPLPPACEVCAETDRLRTDEGQRSRGIGRMRPRMVLYNEFNPDDEAIGSVTQADLRKRPDALIVVGTTLKVPGVKRIVREMAKTVRNRRGGVSIWINNDPEPSGKEFENCWDLIVKGRSDDVAKLAAMKRWDDKSSPDREVTEEEWMSRPSSQPEVLIDSQEEILVKFNDSYKPKLSPGLLSPALTPKKPKTEPALSPPNSPTSVSSFASEKLQRAKNFGENRHIDEDDHQLVKDIVKSLGTIKRPAQLLQNSNAKAPEAAQKRENPASKGVKPLNEVLKKMGRGAKPKAPAKKRASKKKAESKDGKINTAFKQTKVAASSAKDVKSSKSSVDSPMKPATKARGRPAKQQTLNTAEAQSHPGPMVDVSPQSLRNNTSPPYKPPKIDLDLANAKGNAQTTTAPSSPVLKSCYERRLSGTISPKGTTPKGMENFFD
ncbi:MAG: hypothetical protein M1820_010912 [Bogoriella megaspora]|nr:MAG: hypothetical protein M1820_010912 [Bogoriella megaspora]